MICKGCLWNNGIFAENNTKLTVLDRHSVSLVNYSNRVKIAAYTSKSTKCYKKCSFFIINCLPFSLALMLILLLVESLADAHLELPDVGWHIKDPRTEFAQYSIVKPNIFHQKYKRFLTSTLEEDGSHVSDITISYEHQGLNVVADLKLNTGLIPNSHFLLYQNSPMDRGLQTFNKTDIDLCHYHGAIRGKPSSVVAVSTCNGINGLVHDGIETYYVSSNNEHVLDTEHYIFRSADILRNFTCGVEDVKTNKILSRKKRSKPENVIRGPYNANRHSSFVELVIVVDNKVYKSFGENMKKVHQHCKDIANIVNALYVPLNIFVALVGVVVWNESNEIEITSNGDDTLKNFLHYRRNALLNFPNDNAQLLTKEQFEGGVVGKALKGPICTYEYSGGVSMEHSPLVAVVATTVAHEMGHNFGMEHDSNDCECEDEKCIMSAASTSLVPRHWSSCSIDQLNVAFSHGMNYCLRNKPQKLFDSSQCGNGFVEFGEQCDCGLRGSCENNCCDPTTCMLNANASCATGECCDLSTCRPKSQGTECRSAEGECDLSEFCTGESEYCPPDVFRRDTDVCDNGNAYCYKGSCRSRSNQCKILWGPSGESSDHCYGKNVDGNRHGNCGYDRRSIQHIACNPDDIHCGMLHCKHLNERLEFGMESVAILSHSFMNHEGTIIPCRTAIIDLGLQTPDPGLTPNGAKCGVNKMCVNQTCISINVLNEKGIGAKCPNDCNGQGVCNNKGHCHCNIGFAPPDCVDPGQGGSVDSGPASNPSARIGFTRAMYIFFLGIVPCIAIILFFAYYWKQNGSVEKCKSTVTDKVKPDSNLPELLSSTPSSTDDMNDALLKPINDESRNYLHTSIFGRYKGFTLKPLPNSTSPVLNPGTKVALVTPSIASNNTKLHRPAPPIPKVSVQSNFQIIDSTSNAPIAKHGVSLENGSNNRSIISDPILKESTCIIKKDSTLPLKKLEDSKSSVQDNFIRKKNLKEGTIKRIASFLRAGESTGNEYLPKSKPTIDREKLKNLVISSPISSIDDVTEAGDTSLVTRTQSMRSSISPTPIKGMQKFHTLHSPKKYRPVSGVGIRPKSPPPRPPAPSIKCRGSFFNEQNVESNIGLHCSYSDKEKVKNDIESEQENIYTDIDECIYPVGHNLGLLGEIVTEIEKIKERNLYSNTTIEDKKATESLASDTAKSVVHISNNSCITKSQRNNIMNTSPKNHGIQDSECAMSSSDNAKFKRKNIVPESDKVGNTYNNKTILNKTIKAKPFISKTGSQLAPRQTKLKLSSELKTSDSGVEKEGANREHKSKVILPKQPQISKQTNKNIGELRGRKTSTCIGTERRDVLSLQKRFENNCNN